MSQHHHYDVIIIGGSYSGLAAGMALGRALRNVLIIDSGTPCNRQTPYSHNFLTQDGQPPAAIAAAARAQVEKYDTVKMLKGLATEGWRTADGFEIRTAAGETFTAPKLIFATGIRDIMAEIPGYAGCWGISLLHCPYCHGYEVRDQKTGILGNGEYGYEFGLMIRNWTKDLTLYTNGPSTLNAEQAGQLDRLGVAVVEKEIGRLEHNDGYLRQIVFKDGQEASLTALYTRPPFELHCPIPEALGCARTEEGYLVADAFGKTTIQGVFACGDHTSRMRTVANAVATGATAGMMANRELVMEAFA